MLQRNQKRSPQIAPGISRLLEELPYTFLLLSRQRDLQIGWPVFFRVKAAPIYISDTPKEHIVAKINQIVLGKDLSFGKPEGHKRLSENTLRMIHFPLVKSFGSNLIEHIGKT